MEPFNQHFRNPDVDLSAFAPGLTVDNLAATFDGKIYRGSLITQGVVERA